MRAVRSDATGASHGCLDPFAHRSFLFCKDGGASKPKKGCREASYRTEHTSEQEAKNNCNSLVGLVRMRFLEAKPLACNPNV